MNDRRPCFLRPITSSHSAPFILPPPPAMYAQSSSQYHMSWPPPQAPQSALFSSPLAPSSWTNAGPSHLPSLWPSGPPDFLLPFHRYPQKEYDAPAAYSVARSDTSSAISRDSDLSPSPEVAEVVCNAPLVAPIPLPYHSPTFLMYDLPDEDEDLSHPPYTHRPHKRKRSRDEVDDEYSDDNQCPSAQREPHPVPAKRRSIGVPGMPRWDSTPSWGSTIAGATTAGALGASTAPVAAALRHPAAAFSRRHRVR